MRRRARGGGSRLDSGLLVACGVLAVLALALPDRARDSVAGTMRQTVLAPLVGLQQWSEGVRAAVVARPTVLAQAGGQAALALSAPALADENRALRRLLGLAARLDDGFVVAEVLDGGPYAAEHTLLLGVGRAGGVDRFAPVVAADGLIGMVEGVDARTATVITWAHPDFRVSAMSADERAFGIVQPHLGRGAERLLLELRGVPFRDSLAAGATIVSAGLGGTYPRGIPLGTVLEEIVTTERWSRAYLVRPTALTANLDAVLVLRASRDTTGVAGVWLTLTDADSAARSAAAAGDSIGRAEALAELEARRRALAARTAEDSSGRRAGASAGGAGPGGGPPARDSTPPAGGDRPPRGPASDTAPGASP